jgi:hypothetical protein
MNRKQKLMAAYRAIAEKAVDAHLEYKTSFILSAVIIALDDMDFDLDYEKFLQLFAESYKAVLKEPDKMMNKAEDIAGVSLEIHWEE